MRGPAEASPTCNPIYSWRQASEQEPIPRTDVTRPRSQIAALSNRGN